MKGPKFLRFCIPLVEILKANGGSATASEATDLVLEKMQISEKEQQEVLKNGTSRVRNQVAWARNYLVLDGILDSSQRGVWSLTKKGYDIELNSEIVAKIFHEVQSRYTKIKKALPVLESLNNMVSSVKDRNIFSGSFQIDNYPNPFNNSTIINYEIPDNGYVSLELYNILDERIVNLFSGYRQAGKFKIYFNGSNIASGIYYIVLKSSNHIVSHKILLLK